jgi:hypothetical protein
MPEDPNPSNNPEPTGDPVSPVNADGGFIENWADKYGEEAKPTLSRFTKFDDFVTSHMALRKKFGKDPSKLVEIPSEDSSDEVRAEFNSARGVPGKPEDYEFKRSPDLAESIQTDAEKLAAFSQIAHKHNLTPAQYNGVINDYLALVDKNEVAYGIAEQEKNEQARQKGVAILAKQLGGALEERTLRAEAVERKYGDKKAKDTEGNEVNILEELHKENPNLKNSAWYRLVFDNIAEDMSEDRIKGLTSVSTPTPAAIQTKINELRAHESYLKEDHPQHKDTMAQLEALYKKKAG